MAITRSIFHNGHSREAESEARGAMSGDRSPRAGRQGSGVGDMGTKSAARGLPGWIPWAAGGVALCAVVYGLFQLESVRAFANDFLLGDEFEENTYAPRYAPRDEEDESDFGSGDFGSSASERLRSQL